jgi:hypothetical protein
VKLRSFKANTTILPAIISGLCAAIAAYLLIGIISNAKQADNQVNKLYSGISKPASETPSEVNKELAKGYVLAALPVSDLAILKQRFKKGTRVNVIGVEAKSISTTSNTRTILKNIEVLEAPTADTSAFKENDSSLIVLMRIDECERLYDFLSNGTIRVVISAKAAE